MFDLINDIVASPGAFGLSNVADACAADTGCIASLDSHFFWDGIHPMTAGHAILARAALTAVPEPATWLLAVVGLVMLGAERRRLRAMWRQCSRERGMHRPTRR